MTTQVQTGSAKTAQTSERFLDVETKSHCVHLCEDSSAFLHRFANEPSIGLYRISEHNRKTIPQIQQRKHTLVANQKEITEQTYDVAYAILAAKDINKVIAFESVISDIKDTLAQVHAHRTRQQEVKPVEVEHKPKKEPKKQSQQKVVQEPHKSNSATSESTAVQVPTMQLDSPVVVNEIKKTEPQQNVVVSPQQQDSTPAPFEQQVGETSTHDDPKSSTDIPSAREQDTVQDAPHTQDASASLPSTASTNTEPTSTPQTTDLAPINKVISDDFAEPSVIQPSQEMAAPATQQQDDTSSASKKKKTPRKKKKKANASILNADDDGFDLKPKNFE